MPVLVLDIYSVLPFLCQAVAGANMAIQEPESDSVHRERSQVNSRDSIHLHVQDFLEQTARQEKSGPSSTLGEPMAAHDLAHVRNVFTMLLDASNDGNAKKREDISKRLEAQLARFSQCVHGNG